MDNKLSKDGTNLSCTEFDTLLAGALDGALNATQMSDFRGHAQTCADCGPLFTQAEAGMNWLKQLAPVEPPANLVRNILAVTSMRVQAAEGEQRSWLRRASDWISPSLAPVVVGMMQPRFAMTAAMAFFSVSVLLNVAGFRLRDLRHLDLRPSAISTTASLQYHETTARVVKYYENIRIVYEFESRLKALRDASRDEQPAPQAKPKPQQPENESKRQPKNQQNRNYQFDREPTLAETIDLGSNLAPRRNS